MIDESTELSLRTQVCYATTKASPVQHRSLLCDPLFPTDFPSVAFSDFCDFDSLRSLIGFSESLLAFHTEMLFRCQEGRPFPIGGGRVLPSQANATRPYRSLFQGLDVSFRCPAHRRSQQWLQHCRWMPGRMKIAGLIPTVIVFGSRGEVPRPEACRPNRRSSSSLRTRTASSETSHVA